MTAWIRHQKGKAHVAALDVACAAGQDCADNNVRAPSLDKKVAVGTLFQARDIFRDGESLPLYASSLLNYIAASYKRAEDSCKALLQLDTSKLTAIDKLLLSQARQATELPVGRPDADRRYMPGHLQVLKEDSVDAFLRDIHRVTAVFTGIDETTCIKFNANCTVNVSYINPEGNVCIRIIDVSGDVEIVNHVTGVKQVVSSATGIKGSDLYKHISDFLN